MTEPDFIRELSESNPSAPATKSDAMVLHMHFKSEFKTLRQEMNQQFTEVRGDIRGLKSGQTSIAQQVATLTEDVTVLKGDVAVLKSDVAVLKSDVAVLKSDVAVLKQDMRTMKEDMTWVKEKLTLLVDRVK